MRLTIFHKGLLLVAVPLIFEIGCVYTLGVLLGEAKEQIARESHAKEVMLHVDRLRRHWTEGAMASALFDYTGAPMFSFKYKDMLDDIADEMETCKHLCRDNPKQMKRLAQIDQCNLDSRLLLEQIRGEPDPLKAMFSVQSLADGTHPFVVLRSLCDRIIEEEQKVVQTGQAQRIQTNKRIEDALAAAKAAIGITVALTVFFTFYGARHITDRLRAVMINTRKMVNREQLLPEVGGTDEIAELDRTIHRTSDELAELEKFKRELTAMVTHELRTPLTSIQGVLTLLRVGALGELPGMAADKVRRAEINAHRLIRLINDLLDIEKMEAGKLEIAPEATNLQPIIDESVEAVREFAAQHQVTIETGPTDMCVQADPERLVQVVINFLSNAIKYSNEDGVVTITAVRAHDGFAEVRVTDRGRGIPEAFRDKLFERFQQVNTKDAREKKGTGLGLAICKGIIEQHGGSIGVESIVGEGSTFWFRVPIAETPAEPSTKPLAAPQLNNS